MHLSDHMSLAMSGWITPWNGAREPVSTAIELKRCTYTDKEGTQKSGWQPQLVLVGHQHSTQHSSGIAGKCELRIMTNQTMMQRGVW